MAHLVTNQNNAKGDLVLKGVPAWHGLGTVRMLTAFDLALNPQKIEPLNRIITPSNLNYN